MLVSRISPAPRSAASRAQATASRPSTASGRRRRRRPIASPNARRRLAGRRAAPDASLASIATTTHCEPKTSASSPISSGRASADGVDRDLVGAGVEHRLGVGDRADAAADRERDEDVVGGPAGELDDRLAPLVRGGDVEEDELVGALGVVALGELDRVAGVAQVDEVGALDDPPGVDVEAGDDPLQRHRSGALPARTQPLRAPAPPGAAARSAPGSSLRTRRSSSSRSFAVRLRARPPLRLRDQLREPRALVRLEQRQVAPREQRELGDGEDPKPEHGSSLAIDLAPTDGQRLARLGDRERALVERPADDHAVERRAARARRARAGARASRPRPSR